MCAGARSSWPALTRSNARSPQGRSRRVSAAPITPLRKRATSSARFLVVTVMGLLAASGLVLLDRPWLIGAPLRVVFPIWGCVGGIEDRSRYAGAGEIGGAA